MKGAYKNEKVSRLIFKYCVGIRSRGMWIAGRRASEGH